MLFLSDTFTQRSILSLRTGKSIGQAVQPIINPLSLKIVGWYAYDHDSDDLKVLPILAVREIIQKGFVVNDHDAITPIEDMVRMKKILEAEYQLIGTQVRTDGDRIVGVVTDYAADHTSFYVTKLYVRQPLLHRLFSFSQSQLIIDRNQIIDVTPQAIIVRESTEKLSKKANMSAQA